MGGVHLLEVVAHGVLTVLLLLLLSSLLLLYYYYYFCVTAHVTKDTLPHSPSGSFVT